jgi:hypothetical protein
MIVRLADMAVMIFTRLPDRWLADSLYRLEQGGYPVCDKKMRPLGVSLQAYNQPTRRNRQNKPAHTSRIMLITPK